MNSGLGVGMEKFRCRGNQGLKIVESVGHGDEYEDGNRDGVEVLLVFNPAIYGEEGVKGVGCCAAQEFSVGYP